MILDNSCNMCSDWLIIGVVLIKGWTCFRLKMKHFKKFQDTTEALAGVYD